MAKIVGIYKAITNIYEEKLEHLTLYTEQEIRKLAIENRWKGKGTKDELYIVESTNGFDKEIRIKKSKLSLYIKNLDFQYVMFENCDGFILEKCNFKTLVLSSCKNFEITGCSIDDFSMDNSNRNHIKNCTITNVSTFIFSRNNNFEDCTIRKDIVDATIKRTMLINFIVKSIPFTILTLGLVLSYLIVDLLVFSKTLELVNLMGIISVGIVFIFGLVTWIIVLLNKRHPPKKIISE
ncbi:MAG: hypothetical protein ACFE8L_00490 [Candidatus Hodarchaeota archaeon]